MSSSLVDIAQQGRLLSPDDRARLAEMLLESLQDESISEIEAAWQQEIESRVAAYDHGVNCSPR